MAEEDYEMLPHKEIVSLKEELRRLKTKFSSKSAKVEVDSVESLNASVKELISLFKEAQKDFKNEVYEENRLSEKLDDTIELLNTLLDNNEKIASAILSIGDMIKESLKKNSELGRQLTGMEQKAKQKPEQQPPGQRFHANQTGYIRPQAPPVMRGPRPEQQPGFQHFRQGTPQRSPGFSGPTGAPLNLNSIDNMPPPPPPSGDELPPLDEPPPGMNERKKRPF